MSRLRRDSSLVSEQELDLEASTTLLRRSGGRRNIKKMIQDYGYKRLAIDLMIFSVKLGVLIGLAQLISYGESINIFKNCGRNYANIIVLF